MELKNINGCVIYSLENSTLKECIEKAIDEHIDISNIDLSYSDLRGCNLQSANLCHSNLKRTILSYSDLSGANLSHSILCGADLRGSNLHNTKLYFSDIACADLINTDLSGANLSEANLYETVLYDSDLSGANLKYANLFHANLCNSKLKGSDLSGANLCGANLDKTDLTDSDLSGANLCDSYILDNTNLTNIKISYKTIGLSCSCPTEGSFIGWKKCANLIVKLMITEDSLRSSSTSRKCRCSKAKVLEIQELSGAKSKKTSVNSGFDKDFIYEVGKICEVSNFDNNKWNECSTGIHFFIDRNDAVTY